MAYSKKKTKTALKGYLMTAYSMKRSLSAIILFAFILSACQFPMGSDNPETPSPTTIVPPAPTPTDAPLPPRTLTICLGEEPNTLYPLGGPNAAARSVLDAVYDGPMDVVGYSYEPVILERVPSLATGDALLEETPVQVGDLIVDADGNLTFLDSTTRVRPAGCRSDDCAIDYDGVSPLNMDQLIVNFGLLDGLVWSDGEPLTADDSIFAYNLTRLGQSSFSITHKRMKPPMKLISSGGGFPGSSTQPTIQISGCRFRNMPGVSLRLLNCPR